MYSARRRKCHRRSQRAGVEAHGLRVKHDKRKVKSAKSVLNKSNARVLVIEFPRMYKMGGENGVGEASEQGQTGDRTKGERCKVMSGRPCSIVVEPSASWKGRVVLWMQPEWR